MSTAQWLHNQGIKNRQLEKERQARELRTASMEEKQMQLMDAEIANLMAQGGGTSEAVRQEAAKNAADYLGKWNASLQKSEGMYSSAISEVGKAGELIDRAYGDLGELDALGEEIKGEWQQFKQNYGGIQEKLLGGADQTIADRSQLQRQFMELSRGDVEGEASRALTDVAGQAEQGRQAEARRLQDLGIDPTSGKYRQMMSESRTNQAVGGVMAANKARTAEKERVAGITATGLNLIDPTRDINAAAQIQQLSSNLLSQRTNMATTKAGLATGLATSRGNLATTTANIAGGQAQNIGGQYGSMGAAQQGIAYANTPGDTTPGTPSGTLTPHQKLQQKSKSLYDQFYG